MKIGQSLMPIALMSPTFFFILIYIIAIFSTLSLSFYHYVPGGQLYKPTITLENYIRFFSSSFYLGVLLVTLRIGLFSTVISTALGYPAAYYLARSGSIVKKKILLTLVIMMFLTSLIVRLFAWMLILGRYGVFNNLLAFFGVPTKTYLGTELAVITGLVHFLLPFAILSLVGPIKSIDPHLEEASKNLGANEIQTFFRITLPLSIPGIIATTTIIWALAAAAFITPSILGAGFVSMLSNLIYDSMIVTMNLPFGSAVSVLLFIVSLTIVFAVDKILKKWWRK